MSISRAIKNNVIHLKGSHDTYKENVLKVTLLMSSVVKSNLPPLNITPSDYNEFSATLVKAKASALQWTNGPLSRLLSIPQNVQSYNKLLTPILQDSLIQVKILEEKPDNKLAKEILSNDLANLSTQMNLIVSSISASVTSIKDFKSTLPSTAQELSLIADKAIKDSDADEKEIKNLEQKVKYLNDEIDRLTAEIVALGIADAAAIAIGVSGFFMPFPANVAIWIFSGAAIAAATTTIVIDGIKISNDQDQVKAAQDQMNELTADMSTLKTLSNNFNRLSQEVDKIEGNVQQVLDAWLNLESDINAAITDINEAIADGKSGNYSAVHKDIEDAISDWNTTYNEAGSMYLNLEANNANVEVGMNQEQVKNAISESETMSVIAYLNSAA